MIKKLLKIIWSSNICIKVLDAIVDFQIKIDYNPYHGKYKKGDLVKYNWKYKSAFREDYKNFDKIRIVDRYQNEEKITLCFTDGGACDSYWVRKIKY